MLNLKIGNCCLLTSFTSAFAASALDNSGFLVGDIGHLERSGFLKVFKCECVEFLHHRYNFKVSCLCFSACWSYKFHFNILLFNN
ncbi:unnamed protein product [Moneuplotes crassus]|uniref:Secreted protein n=1 Tax=Euplotes crassus TaxID=5936 RepID=A0AAD1X571_EUPCR|nr:unnamed protein product [Moneuplotes crassus]